MHISLCAQFVHIPMIHFRFFLSSEIYMTLPCPPGYSIHHNSLFSARNVTPFRRCNIDSKNSFFFTKMYTWPIFVQNFTDLLMKPKKNYTNFQKKMLKILLVKIRSASGNLATLKYSYVLSQGKRETFSLRKLSLSIDGTKSNWTDDAQKTLSHTYSYKLERTVCMR